MYKFSLISSFSTAAALAIALVSPAAATTVTVGGTTVANEGVESSQAGATTITFDGLTALSSAFTSTNTNPLVIGNSANVYATPAGDTSTFISTGVGTVTETLSNVNYFGFYWGSPDSYNTFTLTDSSGTTFSYTGISIAGTTSQIAFFANFFSTPGTTFTKATFTSTAPSFEFDNITTALIAASTATPEPGTIAMLFGGLLMVVGLRRSKKIKS